MDTVPVASPVNQINSVAVFGAYADRPFTLNAVLHPLAFDRVHYYVQLGSLCEAFDMFFASL